MPATANSDKSNLPISAQITIVGIAPEEELAYTLRAVIKAAYPERRLEFHHTANKRKTKRDQPRHYRVHSRLVEGGESHEVRGSGGSFYNLYLGKHPSLNEANRVGQEWVQTGKEPERREPGSPSRQGLPKYARKHQSAEGEIFYKAHGKVKGTNFQIGHYATPEEAHQAAVAYITTGLRPARLKTGMSSGYRRYKDEEGEWQSTRDPEKIAELDQQRRGQVSAREKNRSKNRRAAATRATKTFISRAQPEPTPPPAPAAPPKLRVSKLTNDQVEEIKEYATKITKRLANGGGLTETSNDFITLRAIHHPIVEEWLTTRQSGHRIRAVAVGPFLRLQIEK